MPLLAGVVAAALAALGGFGVKPNAKAPSPAEVMKYAPKTFDAMIYLDLEAVLPHNVQALEKFAAEPKIKGTEIGEVLAEVLVEIGEVRSTAKQMFGLDPITDLKSVAVFADLSGPIPNPLVVVRGSFDKDTAAKLAALPAAPTMKLSMAPDGSLLAGVSDWVDARSSKKWKPLRPARGSPAARAQKLLRAKPFFALFSNPSKKALEILEAEIGSKQHALRDLLLGHEIASLALRHNGVTWSYRARTSKGYQRALLASEGAIDLLRAFQHGARGFARLLLAGLDSYESEEGFRWLADHRELVMELVMATTGDGRFRARVHRRPRERTISVAATGKKLSDVLPLGAMVAGGAVGYYVFQKDAANAEREAEHRALETESGDPPRLDVRRRYLELKRRYPELAPCDPADPLCGL